MRGFGGNVSFHSAGGASDRPAAGEELHRHRFRRSGALDLADSRMFDWVGTAGSVVQQVGQWLRAEYSSCGEDLESRVLTDEHRKGQYTSNALSSGKEGSVRFRIESILASRYGMVGNSC